MGNEDVLWLRIDLVFTHLAEELLSLLVQPTFRRFWHFVNLELTVAKLLDSCPILLPSELKRFTRYELMNNR